MAEDIDIKIIIDTADAANSVAGIKKSIKDLNNAALTVGEGGKGFEELTAAAGKLKNKMGDLNAQTNALNGSGVEKLTAGMGLLKEAFTSANPQKVAAGFNVIGTAMKAIPIFLIIEGIKFLIENFEKLKNSGGLLGKVFTAIGDVISWVVQQLKDFADWIGITSFAADEAAAKTIANAKAIGAANQARYDDEIALAEAAGKDTTAIEKKKQEDIIKTSMVELEQIRIRATAQGNLNDEQIKRVQELGKQIHDANLAIQVVEIKAQKKTQDEKDKINDEAGKKAKSDKEKRLKAEEDYNNKLIEQAKIGGTKIETLERELNRARSIQLAATQGEKLDLINKYLLEDLDAEKASYEKSIDAALEAEIKKGGDVSALTKKYADQQIAGDKYYADKANEINNKKLDDTRVWLTEKEKLALVASKKLDDQTLQHDLNVIEHDKATNSSSLEDEKKFLTDKARIELSNTDLTGQQKLDIVTKYEDAITALEEEHNKKRLDNSIKAINSLASSVESILTAVSDYNATIANEEVKVIEEGLTAQMDANDLAMQHELAVDNLTAEQKTAIRKKYEQADYLLKLDAYNKETAIRKKAFEQDKKMKIAQVVISTITGSISALTGMISAIPGPVGIILGALAAAAVVAAGVIQIAKIKATTFDAGSAPAAPPISEGSTGAGAGFQGAGLERIGGNGPQKTLTPSTGGGGSTQPQKVYVVSEDITTSQNKNAVLERRASFA